MKVIFVKKHIVNYIHPGELEQIQAEHFPEADHFMLDTRPYGNGLDDAKATDVIFFKESNLVGHAILIPHDSVVRG